MDEKELEAARQMVEYAKARLDRAWPDRQQAPGEMNAALKELNEALANLANVWNGD